MKKLLSFVLALLAVTSTAQTTIVGGGGGVSSGSSVPGCTSSILYASAASLLGCDPAAVVNGSVSTAGRSILTIADTITGSSATSNFLNITGAFPGTLSAETTGALFAFTVDNDGQTQSGLKATIAGAGGSVDTAIRGAASNTGTYSVGVMGETSGVATNAVGVFGYAAAGTSRVGGYFDLGTNVPAPPSSVGLYVNNSAVAAPIFIAADNGTAVLTVADGGTMTTRDVVVTADYVLSAGTGTGYGMLGTPSQSTPDAGFIGTGSTSSSWHFGERADFAFNFENGACGTSACTDPGFIIHSAVQDTTQYNHNAVWGTAGGAIKTLTESAATSVVRIPIANLAGAFGKFCYTVKAADATDSQIRGSCIKYTVTAKAGTETCSLNTEAALTSDASITETEDGSGSGAITTGTLTYAITCDVTPSNAVDLQINAVSSLTQTTLNVQYNLNHVGPGQPARQ